MRYLLSFFCFFFLVTIHGQEDFLAKQYFGDGEFEKAVVFYEKLVDKNPRRTDYSEALIACYQQLERYEDAENFLLNKIQEEFTFPTFYIELGYNYTLQNQPEKAKDYYQKAIQSLEQNPNFGYSVGYRFQKYALLDEAIAAYTTAMCLKPDLNYDFQLARIYGEQGDIEKMFQSYLKLVYEGKSSRSRVLRNIDDFITEDATNTNNGILRKTLLLNAQKNPDILWNELLSWLFVQQKQYKSAFAQEKAIFKRTDESSFDRLNNLGEIAQENSAMGIAKDIFSYVEEKATDPRTKLNAQLSLIDIDLLDADDKQLNSIEKQFEALLQEYGCESKTLQLQIAYANFLTFKREQPAKAINILKKGLDLPLSRFGKAYIKMALGDILVYDQRFNEALIYFSQIQKSLKNDVIGQDARYKVAQTSFYKGDFDWALTQLKVLRGSTSQLIANDAMQLSLQNKYDAARFNYQKIIEFYASGILADDAHFRLAQLYENKLNEPEKAKPHYEKIIYSYQDSYYFPQARKNFRKLRGDLIN